MPKPTLVNRKLYHQRSCGSPEITKMHVFSSSMIECWWDPDMFLWLRKTSLLEKLCHGTSKLSPCLNYYWASVEHKDLASSKGGPNHELYNSKWCHKERTNQAILYILYWWHIVPRVMSQKVAASVQIKEWWKIVSGNGSAIHKSFVSHFSRNASKNDYVTGVNFEFTSAQLRLATCCKDSLPLHLIFHCPKFQAILLFSIMHNTYNGGGVDNDHYKSFYKIKKIKRKRKKEK